MFYDRFCIFIGWRCGKSRSCSLWGQIHAPLMQPCSPHLMMRSQETKASRVHPAPLYEHHSFMFLSRCFPMYHHYQQLNFGKIPCENITLLWHCFAAKGTLLTGTATPTPQQPNKQTPRACATRKHAGRKEGRAAAFAGILSLIPKPCQPQSCSLAAKSSIRRSRLGGRYECIPF